MALVLAQRRAWVQAFRLHTLPLAVACIMTGAAVAYQSNPGTFSWLVAVMTALVAVCLQILSNLANDYGDTRHGADSDKRVGPERAVQAKLISIDDIKRAIIIFVMLSFLSGMSLLILAVSVIGIWAAALLLLVGLLAIAAAIAYTATSNPYGYQGLGDLSVFIFFGIIGVYGAYYLQTGHFGWEPLMPAAGMGLLCTSVLNVNNIRDFESDLDAGKMTVAVRLGVKNAKIYHWLMLMTALTLFILYGRQHYAEPWRYAFLAPGILFIVNAFGVSRTKHATEVIPYLKMLVLSTLAFALSFSVSLII